MEAYYYGKMNRECQAVYRAMKQGFESLAESFQVPRLDGATLHEVFFQLRLDHPEIFWVSSFKYKYYQDSPNLIMIPEYLFEKSKIQEHQKALKARVEKLVRPAQKMSEWEKEKYIHDFICENVRYDKLKKPYSHEIIGPLGQGVGVCEGIAKSVKVLCDAMGIWCMIALCGNNPEKGIKYRHTWNIVKINGTYYHLDATFDNSLSREKKNGEWTEEKSGAGKNESGKNGSGKDASAKASEKIRYDYFNLDDKAVFRDHEPLIAPAPSCTDGDHFYYREKKLSFTKVEDVYKRAQQTAKKGKEFTFHWRGGYLTKTVLEELLECMAKAGTERQKKAKLSLNWPQAVMRLSYVPDDTRSPEELAQMVTMEDANEGEQE